MKSFRLEHLNRAKCRPQMPIQSRPAQEPEGTWVGTMVLCATSCCAAGQAYSLFE
jgi:hypothetical protein